MATGEPHVRRLAVKGVRVQSRWQVDLVAREASCVQMYQACWEGTCATRTCGSHWPLSAKPMVSDPLHPSIVYPSFLSLLPLAPSCLCCRGTARDY